MALVPRSAHEKALLRGRWLRVFILVVILLGGFFAIQYLRQPYAAPVKASATVEHVEPATPPLPGKEPTTEKAPLRTGSTYLQVSATHQQGAERLIADLRKKNFEAIASEIDGKPGTVRVLVGPVNIAGVVQLRTDLERAGFPGNAAVRRTLAESKPISPSARITKEETSNRSVAVETHAESDPPNPAGATKADANNQPVARQAYLEFSATSQQAAEIIADELHVKGFDATASENQDPPGIFRVLVRPVNDASIDQLRADLERAGFHGNAAILRISK